MDDHYRPYGAIGGIAAFALLFLSSFFGSILIYGPVLPLMFVWPWLYRRIVEILGSMWQSLIVAVFESILGIDVVVTGDPIERHEKTVVLLNHRTRLDWLYFLIYVFHAKILNRHKIALKSALKWIPGLGWAMQVAAYIFLDRNWETDQGHINKILRYFVEMDIKPNILFFPEGTDLSDHNKERSKAYAKKQDLPEFDYVLHPRKKGFTHFVNTLRNISGIHAVHDVTVAYPYNIPTTELDVVKGNIPKAVHFHIKRFDITDLPESEEDLGEWCHQRWCEKEEQLRKFYAVEEPSARKFPSSKKPPSHPRTILLWLSLFVWTSVTMASLYLLVISAFVRWYASMIIAFYICQGLVLGGVEKMEMLLYDQFRKPFALWGITSKDAYASGDSSKTAKSASDVYDKYLK